MNVVQTAIKCAVEIQNDNGRTELNKTKHFITRFLINKTKVHYYRGCNS